MYFWIHQNALSQLPSNHGNVICLREQPYIPDAVPYTYSHTIEVSADASRENPMMDEKKVLSSEVGPLSRCTLYTLIRRSPTLKRRNTFGRSSTFRIFFSILSEVVHHAFSKKQWASVHDLQRPTQTRDYWKMLTETRQWRDQQSAQQWWNCACYFLSCLWHSSCVKLSISE